VAVRLLLGRVAGDGLLGVGRDAAVNAHHHPLSDLWLQVLLIALSPDDHHWSPGRRTLNVVH
jgi:hypothetical protein